MSTRSRSSLVVDSFPLDGAFSSRPSSAASYMPQGNVISPSDNTNSQPKYPPGLPMPPVGRQQPFPNAPAAPFAPWPSSSESSKPGSEQDFPHSSQGFAQHRSHPYRRPSVSSSGFEYSSDSMNCQPKGPTASQFWEFYSVCPVPPTAQPFVEMSLQWAEANHYKRVQALYGALQELTVSLEIARRETPSAAADSGPHRIHHSTAGLAPLPGHVSNPSGQPPVPEKLTIETLINFSKCFAPGPPTRPAHLQESVIYTRAQAKVLAYGNNEGKVVVKWVLREADGTPLSDDDFRSLMDYGRHVAYLLYYQKSPKAPKDAIRGVKYVKTYNRTLWNGGIALLEFVCPQLAYCQGSMKAQAVLGVSLDWWRQHDEELIRQRPSKPKSHSLPQHQPPSHTCRTTSPQFRLASPQFRLASPQFRHASPPHPHQASRQQFKDKGKARDPGPSHTTSKRDSSVLSPIHYAGAKRNRYPAAETATSEDFSEAINMVSDDDDLDNDIANTTARPAAPPSPSPSPAPSLELPPSPPPPSPMSAASSKMTSAIDLSWIEVTPTYDGLLAYLDAQETAESHLDAIPNKITRQVRQVVINFGQNRLFQHGIPDVNTSALLRTMLDTDTLMVDEDNDNRQWGHSHYKSGINNTLLTWGSVGSVGMAFQLLAAGLRISACARHICYKRRIHIPADSTLIADVYLERLTNQLVHVWQKADGPMGGFTAPFVAPLLLPQPSSLPQPSGLPLPPPHRPQIPILSPQPSRLHGLGHVLSQSGTFGQPELLLPSGPTGTSPIVDDDDNNDMAIDNANVDAKLRQELDSISMPDCRLILQGLGLTPPKAMKKPAFIEYIVKLTAGQDAETSSRLIADISRKAMSKSKATVPRPKPRRIMPPVTQIPPVFSPPPAT
ncbi:hypothetical protein PLEOSDRAFT_1101038 [Pleurotus ostreatus PC15]|uniref:Uncharacterized protein n=1 Tax=Pleurotus ostreatus (strain PC15) TaxID=1137138 RepID=A0A067P2B4_PLEO1|nr:hypothetical protein PLEOSDRAFT_1101038 [Pleurotus ostreatus PC15]